MQKKQKGVQTYRSIVNAKKMIKSIQLYWKKRKLNKRLWYQLGYHVFMNHWKAAHNICNRIKRVKAL